MDKIGDDPQLENYCGTLRDLIKPKAKRKTSKRNIFSALNHRGKKSARNK